MILATASTSSLFKCRPLICLFLSSVFSNSGPLVFYSKFYNFGALNPALGPSFSLSLWIFDNAPTTAQYYLLTLGRSPTNYVGEFILELTSDNAVRYWEFGSEGFGLQLVSSTTLVLGE